MGSHSDLQRFLGNRSCRLNQKKANALLLYDYAMKGSRPAIILAMAREVKQKIQAMESK
jgi:hypothetical protein